MLGDSQPDPKGRGLWPHSPGPRRCGLHLQSPATVMTYSAATPPSPLGPLRPLLLLLLLLQLKSAARVGPRAFCCTRVDSVTAGGASREERAVNWLFTPQVHGAGGLRFCTTPEASSACACRYRVRASECELSEKHAFWHKTRDITPFIGFEALLLPEVTALSTEEGWSESPDPPCVKGPSHSFTVNKQCLKSCLVFCSYGCYSSGRPAPWARVPSRPCCCRLW